jgi:hypothetical protein
MMMLWGRWVTSAMTAAYFAPAHFTLPLGAGVLHLASSCCLRLRGADFYKHQFVRGSPTHRRASHSRRHALAGRLREVKYGLVEARLNTAVDESRSMDLSSTFVETTMYLGVSAWPLVRERI